MSSYAIQIEVAKEIWKIAGKSAEHGNAVMDVIGEEAYLNVMELQREDSILEELEGES